MEKLAVLVIALNLASLGVEAQWDPYFVDGRSTIVQLFEWRWSDIAKECKEFLAPYGYAAVQVSPPTENRIIDQDGIKRPWYERYQPISYKLETRSGTEQEFKTMVKECNSVGVRIIVDVVINHNTNGGGKSKGTGGSDYSHDDRDFPVIPYSGLDYNGDNCPNPEGIVKDYQNPIEVRNCKLDGLLDLSHHNKHVQGRIVEYLNRLVSYGVAGFRIDAAKHMWPGDLEIILPKVSDLSVEHGFAEKSRPFILSQVIDFGGEGVGAGEYLKLGRVTEFRFGSNIGDCFRKWNGQHLSYLKNFGEGWGFISGDHVVAFLDNHDNQRGHGAPSVLSHKLDRLYKMAQAFTLAWAYGIPRVMSSYTWDLTWYGPPHDDNYNTRPVTTNPDLTCNGGWVCEHRWRQIYSMAKFRNIASFEPVTYWWDNGFHQIAFSRGNKGFLAINNEDFPMDQKIATTIAAGNYCDVISGKLENGKCTGRTVIVNGGFAHVIISNTDEDPVIAIHEESRIGFI